MTIYQQLNRTFESILFKSGVFYLPTTPKLNEAGLNASSAGALALEWFSSVSVLRALSGVLDAFKVMYSITRLVRA